MRNLFQSVTAVTILSLSATASAQQICAEGYYFQANSVSKISGDNYTQAPDYSSGTDLQGILGTTVDRPERTVYDCGGKQLKQSLAVLNLSTASLYAGGSATGSASVTGTYNGSYSQDTSCHTNSTTTHDTSVTYRVFGVCTAGEPPSECEAGEQGGEVVASGEGQDGCDTNGCAVVSHAANDGSLHWGTFLGGPNGSDYIAQSTMVGGQCSGSETVSSPEDYSRSENGVEFDLDPANPDCVTANGDQICGSSGTGTQCYEVGGQSYCTNSATNCIPTPSGGRVCAVNPDALGPGEHLQDPGVPNDGTGEGQTPAQPDAQMNTGNGDSTIINYYTSNTVNNSTGDVGESDPQPTPGPTASPAPGECEENPQTCDAETNTDELKQASEERHDAQTKDALDEGGWSDPDTSFFDAAPMISPGDSCPTVNFTIMGKDVTFPSPGICDAFAQMRRALAWLLYMYFVFDSLGVLSRTLKAG